MSQFDTQRLKLVISVIRSAGYELVMHFCWTANMNRQDRQTECDVTKRPVSATVGAVEIRITYSECVFVALGTQRQMRMPHILICGLPRCTTVFYIISYKRQHFREEVCEYDMCILIFSANFVGHISKSKNKWARYDQECILVFMYKGCW